MDLLSIEIFILSISALGAAFFSASEGAFFSLKKSDLYAFSISDNITEKSIYRLMAHPKNILTTILVGALFLELVISSISTRIFLGLFPEYGHFISVAVVTPIVIFFCEMFPKVVSINSYLGLSRTLYPLINAFHIMFMPIRLLLLLIVEGVIKLFRLNLGYKVITEEELRQTLDIGVRNGLIHREENNFIRNVMRFSGKEASNIMFPRNSAIFIPYGASIKDAANIFKESMVVRAPVFRKDYDDIVGMVDSRELVPYFTSFKKARNINPFIKEINFFPATRNLNELLKDFLSKRIEIGVLVDEYGGTAGIVTLNAILTELMGNGFSNSESGMSPDIKSVGEKFTLVSGMMQIDDYNVEFSDTVKSINSDTIGGYITEILERMPVRGDIVETPSATLRVRFVRRNRIESVEVYRKDGTLYDR